MDSGQNVICGNLRNLRTIEKAGTNGPQITLITQIVDMRNLCVLRPCGKWARDETVGRA
ncbi:MAG: hypothetical protein LBK61_10490 [Spirochaetaceae bacterium]|nr:hypothetical protein [Spirochaetaceae bacterium]